MVSDATAARTELSDRGVDVSDLMVVTEADRGTFFGFQDPDGNSWSVQEIKGPRREAVIPQALTGMSEWAGR